jgi:chemotaxis response regulator CheB
MFIPVDAMLFPEEDRRKGFMRTQRIILVDDSRLLGEMLGTVIHKDAHLQTVRKVDGREDLPSAIEEFEAEWVVMTLPLETDIPAWVNHFMEEHPAMRFMAIFAGSGKIKMKWLESHEEEVEDVSLTDVLQILESDPQRMTDGL